MMPILSLTHIQYIQLSSTTWCATAQVSEFLSLNFEKLWGKPSWLLVPNTLNVDFTKLGMLDWQYCISQVQVTLSARENAHNQHQLQRKGVRLLLQQLLNKLEISDTLDESNFPYRLINHKHYVCFSHTGSKNKSDISNNVGQTSDKTLKSKVAVIISHHRPVGIDVETNGVAWQVAQRFYSDNEISTIQSLPTIQRDIMAKLLWQIKESFIKIHHYKLTQGLGMDYAYLITHLINILKDRSPVVVINDHQSDYQIAILLTQRTVAIF